MKKTIVYTMLVLAVTALFSCRKEYSVGNGNLPADFTAQINGVTWDAEANTQYASIMKGTITIVGISAAGQQLSISLNDTIVGDYVLNQQSTSIATFSNVDSNSFYDYGTDQSSDTSKAGGSVNVLTIDPVGKTISGIFSFKAYRLPDGAEKVFTSGIFYRIPYSDTLPSPSKLDTLTASIDSVFWPGIGIGLQSVNGELAVYGADSDGTDALTILVPLNSQPGSYSLGNISLDNCEGVYNPTPSPTFISSSGSINVVENDFVRSRLRGNFSFVATDPTGTLTHVISNGYFSVYYGQ